MSARLTHVGGPTVLIEIGGWRLLTDPTFDPAGDSYRFGWGTGSRKLAGPALAASEIGPIDAVLLSHDHHDDNLDPAGRALLPAAGTVVTTGAGARRLGGTPCRHGPPLSRPLVGDVIGFGLGWEGQQHGALWISGDTVLYDGVREVAERLRVGTALVHLGGVRFPISGPLHYTMTAAQAVELCGLLQPQTTIPIHYEGWKHFRQHRDAVEREFAAAPQAFRDSVRWLPLGSGVEIEI